MRWAVAGLIYFALTSTGVAQQHEEAVIMGAGVATCAEFGQAYQRDPDHAMAFYFSWAQGAMSNTNMLKKALKQSQRDLNGMPVSEQMDRLRMFCDRKPLAHLGDAVIKLFYEPPEISPQSN